MFIPETGLLFFSDGTRESPIVTKMFLVEEAIQDRHDKAEMSEELQGKQVVLVAKPARRFSPALQILSNYHYSFLQKFIVFTVNEHQKISIAGLNCQAGFATG